LLFIIHIFIYNIKALNTITTWTRSAVDALLIVTRVVKDSAMTSLLRGWICEVCFIPFFHLRATGSVCISRVPTRRHAYLLHYTRDDQLQNIGHNNNNNIIIQIIPQDFVCISNRDVYIIYLPLIPAALASRNVFPRKHDYQSVDGLSFDVCAVGIVYKCNYKRIL